MVQFRKNVTKALGFLAVFVGLIGAPVLASVAANEVLSGHIKDNEVRTQDIRNGHVTSEDIKNADVTGSDLENGTVTGTDVLDGGLTGTDIADDGVGTDDLADNSVRSAQVPTFVRAGTPVSVGAGATATATVDCDAGEQALSLGATWSQTIGQTLEGLSLVEIDYDTHLFGNIFVDNALGGFVTGRNDTAGSRSLTAYAVCLEV